MNMWGYTPVKITDPTTGATIMEQRVFNGYSTFNNPITGQTVAVQRTIGGREVISHPITGATMAEIRR